MDFSDIIETGRIVEHKTIIPQKNIIPEVAITSLVSECKPNIHTPVCSGDKGLQIFKDFLASKGITNITDPVQIVKEAAKNTDCNTESCALRKISDKKNLDIESIIEQNFKKEPTDSEKSWLSNFDIDDTLRVLPAAYPSKKFKHIPFQMIDFCYSSSSSGLLEPIFLNNPQKKINSNYLTPKNQSCDINPYFILKQKSQTPPNPLNEFAFTIGDEIADEKIISFGCVLNTDYSTGRGKHWFCIYGELDNNEFKLEYFNTDAKDPPKEILAFLCQAKTSINLNKKCIEKNISANIYFNNEKNVFQTDNHACGVFSVFYIWLRLLGVSYEWLTPENFNSDFIEKIRPLMFRETR